jgi:hypothetical protein
MVLSFADNEYKVLCVPFRSFACKTALQPDAIVEGAVNFYVYYLNNLDLDMQGSG